MAKIEGPFPYRSRNAWHIDTAIGYRFDRHLRYELQYSLDRQAGHQQQGETVAMQLTLQL